MKKFSDFLSAMDDAEKRQKLESILNHIRKNFSKLEEEIKWNQPMFSDHGTFIIAFSVAKGHIAVAPEAVAIREFEQEIEAAGYHMTKELFRIKWADEVDFDLIDRIITYNIEEKKDMKKFWR